MIEIGIGFTLGLVLYFILKDPIAERFRKPDRSAQDYFTTLEATRQDEARRYREIVASGNVTSGMLSILRSLANGMDLWSPPGGPWRVFGPNNPDRFLASREGRESIDVDSAEVEALRTLGYLKEAESPCSLRYVITNKGRGRAGQPETHGSQGAARPARVIS